MSPSKKYIFTAITFAQLYYSITAQIYFIFPEEVKKNKIRSVRTTGFEMDKLTYTGHEKYDKEGRLITSETVSYKGGDTIRRLEYRFYNDSTRIKKHFELINSIVLDSLLTTRKIVTITNGIISDSSVFKTVLRKETIGDLTHLKECDRFWQYNITENEINYTESCYLGSRKTQRFKNNILVSDEIEYSYVPKGQGPVTITIRNEIHTINNKKKIYRDSLVEFRGNHKIVRKLWEVDSAKTRLKNYEKMDSVKRTFTFREYDQNKKIYRDYSHIYDSLWRVKWYLNDIKTGKGQSDTRYRYKDYIKKDSSGNELVIHEQIIENRDQNLWQFHETMCNKTGLQKEFSIFDIPASTCDAYNCLRRRIKHIVYEYEYY